ncbi:MAG: hypothetical protein P8N76_09150 [Pirellulaceae bacterium]|nr:hypothetical protein [Pirellulaceae bacterium]
METFHGLLQHDPVERLRDLGDADQFARDVPGHDHNAPDADLQQTRDRFLDDEPIAR